MGVHLERAQLLIGQSRYEMAEKELRQELSQSPDSAIAHALLGLCLSYRQKHQEATKEAQIAIGLAPDWAYAHYILAYILCDREHLRDAEISLAEAIRIDPANSGYFALRSRIRYNQRLWQEALNAAQQGLAIDPEDVECLNYHALALSQLGRAQEAKTAIEDAIAKDPENASSYASLGWILLTQGKNPNKASESFREALRLNPTFEWARQGIVEAMKAKNPIYRVMLRYFLFCSRLDNRPRLLFSIGLYFVFRLLVGGLAVANLNPLLWLIGIAYISFVVLTWIADPLFTLLLRFDKFGRLILSEEEINKSNLFGGLSLCIIIAVAAWFTTKNPNVLAAAISLIWFLLPVSATLQCPAGSARKFMTIYTIILAIAWLMIVVLQLLEDPSILTTIFFSVFFLGGLLSTWVANALMGVKQNK